MKYTGFFLFLLFQFSVSTFMEAQNMRPPKDKFDVFLSEVYANNVDYIKPSTRRYKYMKELYENRIVFTKEDTKLNEIGYELLSNVPLFNKYNKNLKRDLSFSINNFNPFKYNFLFYDKSIQVYKVDGTDYFILIYPQSIAYNRK